MVSSLRSRRSDAFGEREEKEEANFHLKTKLLASCLEAATVLLPWCKFGKDLGVDSGIVRFGGEMDRAIREGKKCLEMVVYYGP